jgi:hypothetical protein
MFPTTNLTPGQRRQMRKIVDRVEQMTQADRLFFERFPSRQHRVRVASQAEIEERRIVEDLPPIPDGLRFFHRSSSGRALHSDASTGRRAGR